jgi:hypothetical protein
MDINRYFVAVPGITKQVEIGWHDYEDDRSLSKLIHIPIDEDPESGAIGFLMEYVPGMYDFEWAHEYWTIEIGPVFEGPGPGDGSDASFERITFRGTKEEATVKANELCSVWASRTGGYREDLGHFKVSFSISEVG